MKSELATAIKQVCDEKNISMAAVIETIEAALAAAYRKDYGEKNQNIRVTFDPVTGGIEVFDVKEVVEDEFVAKALAEAEAVAKAAAENAARGITSSPPSATTAPASVTQELEGELERRYNPKTMLSLAEAKLWDSKAEVGREVRKALPAPEGYGRMAAQTAKQVIIQKIREAERNQVFAEFKSKEGELISGVVQRVDGRAVFIDLGRMVAVLPPSEQATGERLRLGERVKVYVKEVKETPRGPEVVVSRAHPEIVRRLFQLEVPEVAARTVEVREVAREAGSRTKVAVAATDPNIDPIGSCVGQRGTRVQTIINELGGEKLDIIEYHTDPVHFIINALSPAKVVHVELDEERHEARAFVKEDQLSLAIGKGGQNVRLAGRLTGWRIDILQEGLEEGAQPVASSEVILEAEPETAPVMEVGAASESNGQNPDDQIPITNQT
ncbi:MAG: transcription termination factor NusA [Patescibacteria group bacterium]